DAGGSRLHLPAPCCASLPPGVDALAPLSVRQLELDAAATGLHRFSGPPPSRLALSFFAWPYSPARFAPSFLASSPPCRARTGELPIGGEVRRGNRLGIGVPVHLEGPVDLRGDRALQLDNGGCQLIDGGQALRGHGRLAGWEQHLRLEHEAVADDADVLAVAQQLAQAPEEVGPVPLQLLHLLG